MQNLITPEIRKQVMQDILAHPEYRKLNEKYKTLRNSGNFMQASFVMQKMKMLEAKTFGVVAKKYIDSEKMTHETIASMTEEEKDKFTYISNGLFLMADVFDSMIMEAEAIMKKYGFGENHMFKEFRTSLKEAKKAVYRFDNMLQDDDASMLAGQMSDDLYKLVYNKASSFTKKLIKNSEKKSRKKKQATE